MKLYIYKKKSFNFTHGITSTPFCYDFKIILSNISFFESGLILGVEIEREGKSTEFLAVYLPFLLALEYSMSLFQKLHPFTFSSHVYMYTHII